MPADLLDDPKAAGLSASAKRLLVTSWAICDDKGFVPQDKLDAATARWGEEIGRPERTRLVDVLEDLQRLGFVRELRRCGDVFQFKRSGGWLS
jgi:hypothetical protein